jgi:succinyl-CoA synthetase beta subunit
MAKSQSLAVRKEKDGTLRLATRLEQLQAFEKADLGLQVMIEKGKKFLNSEDESIALDAWKTLFNFMTGGKKGGPVFAMNINMGNEIEDDLKRIREKFKGEIIEAEAVDG